MFEEAFDFHSHVPAGTRFIANRQFCSMICLRAYLDAQEEANRLRRFLEIHSPFAAPQQAILPDQQSVVNSYPSAKAVVLGSPPAKAKPASKALSKKIEVEGQGRATSSSRAAEGIQPKNGSPVRVSTTDEVPSRQIHQAVALVNEIARIYKIPDRTREVDVFSSRATTGESDEEL